MSDWDIMMQRRKEAMAKARKRRRRDIDIRAVDDHIMAMIREMRQAVEVYIGIEWSCVNPDGSTGRKIGS